MASRSRRTLWLSVLALACLLVVSNLSQIGAEVREAGAVEAVEDAEDEAEGEDYVGDNAGGDDEEEDEEDEEEDEEDEENAGNRREEAFDETDVVVLGSGNFTAFVTSEAYVMVEFYAPWCGHCQELAPHWAAAATALKGRVSVAKVDATANPDVSEALGVSGYPTLFLFVDGGPSPYSGDRTK
jgi:protein disulfide-isomerase A1